MLLLPQLSWGQDSEDNSTYYYNHRVDIKANISVFNFDFNFNDFYWSISGGIEDIGYQWGARLNFELRPFYKKVQLPEENNIVRQYLEQKYFVSIDVDKRLGHLNLWDTHTQFFMGARSGILFGNYKGTQNDVAGKFIVAPMAGICFNFDDNILLKLGYIHFNEGVINVPDGKVTLGLHILI